MSRLFSPGDHVVKLDWYNKPIAIGVVTQVDGENVSARVLSSRGHTWEYTHDLRMVSEVKSTCFSRRGR